MQRLRTTFKRSRTPTGADMRVQTSLEVPKQVRSASFDEIQLTAQRLERAGSAFGAGQLLRVPPASPGAGNQRSRSFDCGGDRGEPSLAAPDAGAAVSTSPSAADQQPSCFHCVRLRQLGDAPPPMPWVDTSSEEEDEHSPPPPEPPLSPPPAAAYPDTFLLSPPGPSPAIRVTLQPPVAVRRRSITRQEAVAAPDAVHDIFLTVPTPRDRAASVDSAGCGPSGGGLEPPPSNAARSRSVDIVLPAGEAERVSALHAELAAVAAAAAGKAVGGDGAVASAGVEPARPLRTTPDWGETAINGEHLWSASAASGDCCYVTDCNRHGPRLRCAACRAVAHAACLPQLQLACKPSFRDVGVRQYREQSAVPHHWVHRRTQKGKCRHCGKSFQSKLSFSSKEIVALSCSWCKTALHNKEACFPLARVSEECSLGPHRGIIVPPSWIVKLPRRGSFKSSLRRSPKKKSSSKKRSKEKEAREARCFVLKPIPNAETRPVLVFINPRSGGNQGAKLLQKFQWLLNPRQVFDLTQGGPRMGLELYRRVPNLRVLACGGDGTAGWVLSVLDQLDVTPAPPVGVLPLGTGNDLARSLGWGGGYTDEPISKILTEMWASDVVQLDRWKLTVERNTAVAAVAAPAPAGAANQTDEETEHGVKEQLPLNVVNNYFSLGVDAHIALEFHEAREAHPEKFNSRLRNKMFYGQAGGRDLLRRKWRALAEFVTLECDGRDLTTRLRDLKVHAIVFLNIPSYGGGTRPWNRAAAGVEQATDDGLIEVVGLTTYQLPLLQAGGHGTPIAQCRAARIVTTRAIPMQVDGEAVRLAPAVIQLSLLNRAPVLAKRRRSPGRPPVKPEESAVEELRVSVMRISMADYERHHYDKERLRDAAAPLGELTVPPAADLETLRREVAKLAQDDGRLAPDWCFLDCCTAERFFRVDRAQEHLHYVTDVAADQLYVLDAAEASTAAATPAGTPSSGGSREEDSAASASAASMTTDGDLSVGEGDRQEPSHTPTPDSPAPDEFPFSADLPAVKIPPEDHATNDGATTPPPSKDPLSHLLEKTTDGVLRAAKLGDLKTLKELHAAGFSLLSIDAQGQTALHYGSRYGHKHIVRYLIATGPASLLDMADTITGQTALHQAAALKRRSICVMLVAGGASPALEDRRGLTPRLLAQAADDAELAAYLQSQEHFRRVAEDMETTV